MAEAIHRENWTKDKVTSKNRPNWNCPTCNSGHLSFEENWFVREPNSSTKRKVIACIMIIFQMKKNFILLDF